MYPVFKRISDVLASVCVLILLLPLFLIIAIWILMDSPGGVFYKQIRVGLNGREFKLFKFRSMCAGADKKGQITIGNDSRVTKSGQFIRKFKIDEFPQLINIIVGDMSVVGPRPEVPKYVQLYDDDQNRVLSVRPGLTDFATIEYIDEQQQLGQSSEPEKLYINTIMPEKLELNLKYIDSRSFNTDLKIIFKTISSIFR